MLLHLLVFALAVLFLGAIPARSEPPSGEGFTNVLREPDTVTVVTERETLDLIKEDGTWKGRGVEVRHQITGQHGSVRLKAPGTAVKTVRLRWATDIPNGWKYLGDAWERGYGDLQWLPLDPDRLMPWYVLATDTVSTHGIGVMTQPGAMCAWTVESKGITLIADVRCGGAGVQLGNRELPVCTIVARKGRPGEDPFVAAQSFCRLMCPNPRVPSQPVYGFNDWYCDYGNNSAESVRYYAEFVSRLSPNKQNRPFMVIDDGWQPGGGRGRGGPWDRSNDKFPPMDQMAREIRSAGARPGIWVHPLVALDEHPDEWRLAGARHNLDPSHPQVRQYVKETLARLSSWGYELIKHDYSTNDISGIWGQTAPPANASWRFHDPSRTTAEILLDHYRSIDEGAGDALVIGCNTVGHLGAGIFPVQRIGDDTSGYEWARTLKMGVNSLAFRAPQHGTFFSADADCVGLTKADAIPWSLNKQWLDLLAHSGTPLFISFKRGSVTPEQEKDISAALAVAAEKQPLARPLDWLYTAQPQIWQVMNEKRTYHWGTPAE